MGHPEAGTGKVALVTGGGRGIGRATALALAEAGFDVAVNYVSRREEAEAVRALAEGFGRRAMAVQADVSAGPEVVRMVAAVERGLGPVAVLVNNAGIAHTQRAEEITEADWDRTLDVNLKSVFLVTQAVLPGMRAAGWGRIINLSSAAVPLGGIIGPHYTAAKAGVIGLTHAYAVLQARHGITVNAVAPGLIDTDMIAGHPRATPDRVPLGRLGSAGEVAETILLLVRNGYLTGQTLHINGGLFLS